jgi:hypothetical protein
VKIKIISILPAIQWSLMHKATAVSGYFKKFEETHRGIEVFITYPTMSLKGCYQGLPSFPQFFHQS